ncbi:MAG: hypothetical protein V1790_19630 [Planctomycetota bacterium]
MIRYDDYGAAYSDSCAARFEVEEMVQRELAERGWPWLCAVTPRQSVNPHDAGETGIVHLRDDGPRLALLRKAIGDGLCEPAVHGLTHHTWKQLPEYGTEFVGLPADEQCEILRTAKREVEELAGREVSVFVPPWNSFDEATVRAAGDAGFELLSAGIPTCCGTVPPLRLMPRTVDVYGLKQLTDQGRRLPAGSVIVMLFHAFDFTTVHAEWGRLRLDEFGPLLDRAVERYGMEVVPILQIPRILGDDLERRVAFASTLHERYFRLGALPLVGRPILRWILSQGFTWVLPPIRSARLLGWSVTAVVSLWFAGVAVVAWTLASVVGRLIDRAPIRSFGLLTLALGGAVLAIRSAKYAFLKRYRRRWGGRTIGLRTWTSFTAGTVVALSVLFQWLQLP